MSSDALTIDDLVRENEVLRGLVQTNPGWKCPYGVNSNTEMAFCHLGFPGCLCADDRIGVEIVVAAENARLRVVLKQVAEAISLARQFLENSKEQPGLEDVLRTLRAREDVLRSIRAISSIP